MYLKRAQIRALLLCLVTALPVPAFAAPQTFSELVSLLVKIINAASGVAVAIAVALYFWSIVTEMWESEQGVAAYRKHIIWGVVALFVMVSIWGIVSVLTYTFFSSDSGSSGSSTFCTGLSC